MAWRIAFRSLRQSPVSSIVAILSLALGIGACTALFSIFDTLLLKSLPVRDPGRLALLSDARGNTSWTNVQWEYLRDGSLRFDGLAATSAETLDISTSGQTQPVEGLWASGRLFDVLGVPAVLGRTLTEEDDRRGGGADGPVAVISYAFWHRQYGGDPEVVGRAITLNRVPFTIVGVTGPGFFGTTVGRHFDVAVPIGTDPLLRGGEGALDHRSYWWLTILVRLAPGQTLDAGTALVRGIQHQLREATLPGDWPATLLASYLEKPFALEPAGSGESTLRTRYQRPLVTLLAAVGVLLLIACANIGNLMLARATARRHDVAVRAALGASRWSLARPMLVEGLLLAGAGALLGVAFAQAASRLLVGWLSTPGRPVFLDVGLDWRALVFTTGVTVLAAILFGTLPALRTARAEPRDALAQRGTTASRSSLGMSGALVVVQVGLSLVLVVAAGLFGRTFAALASRDLGFDPDRILLVALSARGEAAASTDRYASFERAREAAGGVPGVASAASSVMMPVSGGSWQFGVEVVGEPQLSENERGVYVNAVGPGWFDTYGTSIVSGRDIGPNDVAGAPSVALVNRAFARKFFAGSDPIGRLVRQVPAREPKPPVTIVGVVDDAIYRSLRADAPPTLYLAHAQQEGLMRSRGALSVRSAGPPVATLIAPITRALQAAAPDLALTFRPLSDQVSALLIQERLLAAVSGFFGSLGLLLAMLGLYGVTAHNVSRRRAEIGIRMALGGAPGSVVRLMLRRVALLVGTGIVLGGIASYWAARFLTTLVFGIEARDPATFAAAAAVLLGTALAAAMLPARHASRIDPVAVLRDV